MNQLAAIDRAVFIWINATLRHPVLDVLMPFVSEKWNFVVPVVLVALYLITKGGRRGRWIVIWALFVLVTADASAAALRNVFQRVRPCHALHEVQLLVGCSDSFSFPSGHATNAFALAAFFAVYYRKLAIPLFIVTSLTAYSRIYLGVHYPLDVLGGASLGAAFGLAVGVCTHGFLQGSQKTGADKATAPLAAASGGTGKMPIPPDSA